MTDIFLPFRGEFGHLIMWHAPTVNYHKVENKVVCCEEGQEALFPDANEYIYVPTINEDKKKTPGTHKKDKELFDILKINLSEIFNNPNFHYPVGENWKKNKSLYISYQPHVKQNIHFDVIICPRKRPKGSDRNWGHWEELVDILNSYDLSVFACGSESSSCTGVNCPKSWEYKRFLDATIEAIQNSKIVVCTDSGIAHLSVQCGRRTLIINNNNKNGKRPVKWSRFDRQNHMNCEIININDSWDRPENIAKKIQHILKTS